MTSRERMRALHDAVQYVVRSPIPGAVVECGVWRGGSAMVAAMTMLAEGVSDRDLYLYDTYAGMTEPQDVDISYRDEPARERWADLQREELNEWCYAGLDEVRQNLLSTGYPAERLHLVKGPVEETIPREAPERISILRLDTDWYASTRHEWEHLYPRVSPGGVVIIDDYGHWQGSRKATDEYLSEHGLQLLLHRIDHTGRMALKPFR